MPRLGRRLWRALPLLVVAALPVLPIVLADHLHAGELPVSPTCATCKAVHPIGIEPPEAAVVTTPAAIVVALASPVETIAEAPRRSAATSRGPPTAATRTTH